MFMSDLSMIVRQMRVYAERMLKGSGVGFPEQTVIMYLMSHGTSNQQQIADYLGIDQGAIAKTIGKLESKGLICRETNPDNKREKILTLAPAAAALREGLNSTYLEWSAAIFEGISDEQRAQFEQTVSKMAENSAALLDRKE